MNGKPVNVIKVIRKQLKISVKLPSAFDIDKDEFLYNYNNNLIKITKGE